MKAETRFNERNAGRLSLPRLPNVKSVRRKTCPIGEGGKEGAEERRRCKRSARTEFHMCENGARRGRWWLRAGGEKRRVLGFALVQELAIIIAGASTCTPRKKRGMPCCFRAPWTASPRGSLGGTFGKAGRIIRQVKRRENLVKLQETFVKRTKGVWKILTRDGVGWRQMETSLILSINNFCFFVYPGVSFSGLEKLMWQFLSFPSGSRILQSFYFFFLVVERSSNELLLDLV